MTLLQESRALQTLRNQISGRLLTATDPDYDSIRRGWNLSINQYPALILIASNPDDIAHGLKFAREQKLGISIQSTGHGVKFPADDNLLIVTSQLKGVDVDVTQQSARVSAGVVWQDVLDATTPQGLAPLLGSSPHVGVIGYTLGGGIGWLARRYGLAADSVCSIDLVTLDGQFVHASPSENSDLFKGLLGGGGNFGVITAMEIKLYPVAKLYGGLLTYPEALVGDALYFYRDWVKNLPDEMTSSFTIMKFPNLPQLPEAMRGKISVMLRAAYLGSADEGAKLIQQWLDWNQAESNSFREMPFSDIATISNDPVAPAQSRFSNEMLDELSDAAIDVIIQYASDRTKANMVTELRHAGGAIARVDASANAIGNREAQFYMQMAGVAMIPELADAIDTAIHDFRQAMQPYVRGSAYLNFIGGKDAIERTKTAYLPETYASLQALKAEYDPDNLFRYSFQI